MSKHTPGPWFRIGTDVGTADCSIASMSIMSAVTMKRGEREANARLIAAAPDLLEALALLVAGIEGSVSETYIPLAKARAAIAKATGESK